jgi:hypothetical protein
MRLSILDQDAKHRVFMYFLNHDVASVIDAVCEIREGTILANIVGNHDSAWPQEGPNHFDLIRNGPVGVKAVLDEQIDLSD